MSYWNKAKRFTGWADIDLHDEGKSEAKRAGQLVKDLQIEFDVYFTSQLKRAINSLNIILEVLGKSNVEINKAWELNERHYGNLTSLNKEEIKKKFGNKQVQIWRRSFNTRPPPMDKQHPYREKINLFHGNSCRALLMKILNISKEKIVKLEIPTGNPLLLKFEDNLKVQDYKYLDPKRAKKILFNV